jgi:uncharacterized damage-inducible protein DinB
MVEPTQKRSFLTRILKARKAWDESIAGLTREEMVIPDFCAIWSVKDVIAHIAWYDRAMVEMLEAKELADSPYWKMTLDERNAVIFEENKDRRLDDVVQEATDLFTMLVELLEGLTDDDLNDPRCFPGMPLEWRPWQVLASNTCEHYEAHLCKGKTWCEKRPV